MMSKKTYQSRLCLTNDHSNTVSVFIWNFIVKPVNCLLLSIDYCYQIFSLFVYSVRINFSCTNIFIVSISTLWVEVGLIKSFDRDFIHVCA